MAEEHRRNVGIPVSAVIFLGSEYAVWFDNFSQLTIAWHHPLFITVQSNHVVIISERKVIWQLGPNRNYVRGENFTVFVSFLYDRFTSWITDVHFDGLANSGRPHLQIGLAWFPIGSSLLTSRVAPGAPPRRETPEAIQCQKPCSLSVLRCICSAGWRADQA